MHSDINLVAFEPAASHRLPSPVRLGGLLLALDAVLTTVVAMPQLESIGAVPGGKLGLILPVVLRFVLGLSIWYGSRSATLMALWLAPLALTRTLLTPNATPLLNVMTLLFVGFSMLLLLGKAGPVRRAAGISCFVTHWLLAAAQLAAG